MSFSKQITQRRSGPSQHILTCQLISKMKLTHQRSCEIFEPWSDTWLTLRIITPDLYPKVLRKSRSDTICHNVSFENLINQSSPFRFAQNSKKIHSKQRKMNNSRCPKKLYMQKKTVLAKSRLLVNKTSTKRHTRKTDLSICFWGYAILLPNVQEVCTVKSQVPAIQSQNDKSIMPFQASCFPIFTKFSTFIRSFHSKQCENEQVAVKKRRFLTAYTRWLRSLMMSKKAGFGQDRKMSIGCCPMHIFPSVRICNHIQRIDISCLLGLSHFGAQCLSFYIKQRENEQLHAKKRCLWTFY